MRPRFRKFLFLSPLALAAAALYLLARSDSAASALGPLTELWRQKVLGQSLE